MVKKLIYMKGASILQTLTVGLSVASYFFDYSTFLRKNKPLLRKSVAARC